jgi:hypothetical protein
MFLRVREFVSQRASEFPSKARAGELFDSLKDLIDETDTHTTAQSSGHSATLESSASKASARDELRRDLEAISRTARALALNAPGLEDKFRAPRSVSDQALLTTARSFAADASPLKTEFTSRGLPDNFLDDLNHDIEEFERTISQKIQKNEAQVTATAAIDAVIERGLNIVREIDVIMRNTYADDPATLAAWLSASHTQRTPRPTAEATPNIPPQPAP